MSIRPAVLCFQAAMGNDRVVTIEAVNANKILLAIDQQEISIRSLIPTIIGPGQCSSSRLCRKAGDCDEEKRCVFHAHHSDSSALRLSDAKLANFTEVA
jgi:hypothetical protein